MNRPAAANAMNTQMGLDLMTIFETLQIQQDGLRCVVLTGAGERAFCAGGDLVERRTMSDVQWQAQHAIFERMVRAIINCPLPLVAAVNGAAVGGGCEIAAACDFIYASKNARFALTEVTLGIMPGAGGTQNLTRAVGTRRASEIILTGKPFSAEEAERWGLVNEVVELADLMVSVLATVRRIAGNAPISVRQAKQAVRRGVDMSISGRPRFRDRGLQPHGADQRSPRRRQCLQRETQTRLQGQLVRWRSASTSVKSGRATGCRWLR